MLYYLFDFLRRSCDLPGAGMFRYLSFRAGLAGVLSLLIAALYGKRVIGFLKRKQIGETVRDLGLEGQDQKVGTPTLGGLIIIGATLIPTLLLARLDNVYVALLVFTTIWMGFIGFADDYIKVFRKNKRGLKAKFKVFGQVVLGVVVGATLYFHPGVTIEEKDYSATVQTGNPVFKEAHAVRTTLPFSKHNELDYAALLKWVGRDYHHYAWIVFIPLAIFIITAVSNAINLTDGLDGLAASTASVALGAYAILVWVSGNIVFANYLDIMYIPRIGEVVVFIAALTGGLIGFLWYNTYPAAVFMGDTGSLTIGGVLAVIAMAVRKELLLVLIGGVFFIESLSVILQVTYFKYTKKKYGVGRRVFLMAPLHHHYQKRGWHESKIVSRFLIVAFLLALVAILTLKVR
ncbi:MAG: phospho-N-acetylmuramoyl-pentapeptide-transferase [Flavobacteriales bacterium]